MFLQDFHLFDDYLDMDLDLHDHLVQNPSSTFCVKAIGESMKDAGIQSGDVMIVDRSLEFPKIEVLY